MAITHSGNHIIIHSIPPLRGSPDTVFKTVPRLAWLTRASFSFLQSGMLSHSSFCASKTKWFTDVWCAKRLHTYTGCAKHLHTYIHKMSDASNIYTHTPISFKRQVVYRWSSRLPVSSFTNTHALNQGSLWTQRALMAVSLSQGNHTQENDHILWLLKNSIYEQV